METIANEGDLAPFNDYSENVEYYRIYLFIFSHRHIHSVSNLGMAANLTPQLPWPTKFHALLISDKEIGRILFSLSSLFRSSPWSGIWMANGQCPPPFPVWLMAINPFLPSRKNRKKKEFPERKKKGKNIHGRKNLVFFDIFLRDRYAMLFKDHSKKLQALDGASSVPSIDVRFFPRSSQRHFKIPQTTTSIDHILRWS